MEITEKVNTDFYKHLKTYFETTSKEKILEDWEKSKEFDNVGLSVGEFLEIQKSHEEK